MNISPNEEGRFKLLRFTGIDILFDQIGLSYGVTQGDNSQIQNAVLPKRKPSRYLKMRFISRSSSTSYR